MQSAVSAGHGLLKAHDTALSELQEQLVQLAALRGQSLSNLHSSRLDELTAPGVDELKKRLDKLEKRLNAVRKDLSVSEADCTACLAAAKDAGSAIAALLQDLDELDRKLAGLQSVAADRETLEKQKDEQKVSEVNRKRK